MKYVALLSGGKDSCYNLLHCYKNGHELLAAVSLGPEQGKEELDSYLYQTVGQDAIELIAEALDVPLYRRVISGTAVEQGSEYGQRKASDGGGTLGDETEDLYALLSEVKSQHPDIQGVSVGAILSNYQRVRVEHVCRRLSLTALCYLWQRDQAELLSEMIDAGMQSVLIKVAGIGLTSKHLGKSLADMQPTLVKMKNLYGSHICGEGGEYETFTLDCPLFKRRIKLIEVETVIHSDNDFATVAFLRIKHAILEDKPVDSSNDLQIPPLLEDKFLELHDTVLNSQELFIEGPPRVTPTDVVPPTDSSPLSRNRNSWVAVTNVQRIFTEEDRHEISVEDEVRECFSTLRARLADHSLDLTHCTNINIFLSDMEMFTRINTVYSTFFGISPPARACVAVDLPFPIRVRLDCLAYAEHTVHDRQALHVQSLSYWAPANIGPYSQAITVDERVCISGQIGLVPKNISLPSPQSLALETALSFQHVDRVANALRNNTGGGWVGHVQLALYWLARTTDLSHAKRTNEVYQKGARVPTLFLAVKSLPKGALIEKQVMMHTGRCLVRDEDGESMGSQKPIVEQGILKDDTCLLHWEISKLSDSASLCAVICVRGQVLAQSILHELKICPALDLIWEGALSIRLFYTLGKPVDSSILDLFNYEHPPITYVPCRSISTQDIDDWDYVVCILGA